MCRSRMKTRSGNSTISIVIVTPELVGGAVGVKKTHKKSSGDEACKRMRKGEMGVSS